MEIKKGLKKTTSQHVSGESVIISCTYILLMMVMTMQNKQTISEISYCFELVQYRNLDTIT